MPDGPQVDTLIAAASRLSAQQLSDLARATRKSLGSGVGAYLGVSRRFGRALAAASAASKAAGRGGTMEIKSALLSDAILHASVQAAAAMGRDVSGVQAAWEEYKASVDSGDSGAQRGAFRESRKAFRRGLGGSLDRRWLLAGIGANWALAATLTWDLVTESGPYRQEDRDALAGPWRSVVPLPPSRE